jgi:nitrogen fixation protein NifU and related proteins
MSDLSELYQEVILDHNRRPRNFGVLAPADRQALGHNPLCGDRFTIYVRLADDIIREVTFEGSGCAISKASASLMTEAVKGRRVPEALAVFEQFQRLMTTSIDQPVDDGALGKLAAFSGVREFPMRVKCATLAWHALRSALTHASFPAKTE